MRQLILAVIFSGVLAGTVFGQSESIEGTIQSQIDAFKRDDFATAFSFASPTIQRFFGDHGNFGLMVRQGYPMVWRPSEVRFLGLKSLNGYQYQTVMIRDKAGVFHMLEYQMSEGEKGWQINGVRLIPQPEIGA